MSCSLHTVSGLSGSVLVCDGDSLALSLCYMDCGVQISVAACCPETGPSSNVSVRDPGARFLLHPKLTTQSGDEADDG